MSETMIKPKIIQWAMEEAGLDEPALAAKLKLSEDTINKWLSGEKQPTIGQIEKIAQKLYIPFGYLFASEPPEFGLTVPDFRTPKNQTIKKPSLELLATVNIAREKQAWMKEYLQDESAVLPNIQNKEFKIICREISNFLGIDQLRKQSRDYEDFLKRLIERLDDKGFIVIRNSVVGNNTCRPLSEKEFKGFALHDPDGKAPLIFINGRDYKSSQIFTLIHEVAHIFRGESGIDGDNITQEQKCNNIAAEVLVPGEDFKREYRKGEEQALAKGYKVSTFVILIKAKQCKLINQDYFEQTKGELLSSLTPSKGKGGGNIYNTFPFRAGGKRFLRCMINSTLEGKTLYRDAYHLSGLSAKSFDKYIKEQV